MENNTIYVRISSCNDEINVIRKNLSNLIDQSKKIVEIDNVETIDRGELTTNLIEMKEYIKKIEELKIKRKDLILSLPEKIYII